jgi:hypothetical protein
VHRESDAEGRGEGVMAREDQEEVGRAVGGGRRGGSVLAVNVELSAPPDITFG